MQWLENKYILLLSNRLEGFKRKSDKLFNFKCYLGCESDSKKRRGYIYAVDDTYRYHCHNCGTSTKFLNFLKDFDSSLYRQYQMDVMAIKGRNNSFEAKEATIPDDLPVVVKKNVLNSLPRILDLSDSHTARKYLDSRKISKKFYPQFYYCEDFRGYTNKLIEDKFENEEIIEPRILIPLIDKDKFLVGYQGRSLANKVANDIRYITIMLDKEKPRIFGGDRVNYNKTYYVTEGPFDSTFIDNSIAVCGASIALELLKNNQHNNNAVVVYDNEPRNKETVKKIAQAVDHGFQVLIWPAGLKSKDVNDLIVKEKVDIIPILEQNVYSGLAAMAKLNLWKRN